MASEDNAQTVSGEPVGQQLQRAREQKGLSAADVAKAQHLRPAVIEAIEAGKYEQIDSELFLKGYVRAYASHVGLDTNALMAELDRELEPLRQKREQEVEANPLVDIERRRRRKRRAAKFTLIVGMLALAAYLVFAFVLPGTDSVLPEDLVEESASDAQPDLDPDNETNLEAEAASAPVDSGTEPAAAVEPETSEPVEASIQPEPAIVEAPEEQPETAVVPAQTLEPALASPVAPAEITDTGRLQITFTGDCWVQISDATGNRLVNSLQRGGDQVDVSGEAPLRVVIGAVDAVGSIRFQGEPVDMSSYRVVNNRSEFTLTI
ncbi:RodZ domain-containing protein [Marinobacter sp.]|uniref:RodZ domain-containing protein n=1 Tax=Marinobacter sp. TaxID=50741 RepID=UPI0035C6AB70